MYLLIDRYHTSKSMILIYTSTAPKPARSLCILPHLSQWWLRSTGCWVGGILESSFSYCHHLVHETIRSALPYIHIQDYTTFHNLQCYHAGPSHHCLLLTFYCNYLPTCILALALDPLQRILLQTKPHCVTPLHRGTTAPGKGHSQHPELFIKTDDMRPSSPTLLVTLLTLCHFFAPFSLMHPHWSSCSPAITSDTPPFTSLWNCCSFWSEHHSAGY